MTEKPKTNGSRVRGSATVSGAVGASVIAWAWNGFVGEPAIGPEVAAAMGALVGPVVAYAVSWLPHPHAKEKIDEQARSSEAET